MKGEEEFVILCNTPRRSIGDLRIDMSFPSFIIFYKRLGDTFAIFVCQPRIGLRLRLAAPFGYKSMFVIISNQ